MQSSSAARLACAAGVAAIALAYLPISIAPDALAQTVLPTPTFVSLVPTAQAQPVATDTPQVATKKSVATKMTATAVQTTATATSGTRLVIPSISLNDPIVPVGLTAAGAMAVPNGKTDQVGWYDGGPKPGDVGSAVLDAHVFAAFSKLDQVNVGDSIYVQQNGETLHFVVTATKLFALSDITSQDLFIQTSDRDLNLITCAGKLTADHSTYDHRLVIYATLAN